MSNLEHKKSALLCFITVFLAINLVSPCFSAETWHLSEGDKWEKLTEDDGNEYLLDVADIKRKIAKGKVKPAAEALEKLKKKYPELAGPDLEKFIEAEILFAKKKYIKASRKYEEFLDKWQESPFYESALERQYTIASAFIKGKKRRVLGIFSLSAFEEADNIMHDIVQRDEDAPIAKRALVTLAEGYKQQREFMDAYLVWEEIRSRWAQDKQIGKESLYQMAESLHLAYKGPKFDDTTLLSAKTYYENFKANYPMDVEKYDIDAKIKFIDEQMAAKQYHIAQYYNRADLPEAANLYYQHVEDKWPATTAAKFANDRIEDVKAGKKNAGEPKTSQRKLFDTACLFLDNWFGLSALE